MTRSYRTSIPVLLSVLLCAGALPMLGQQKITIGYYPSWKWEDRNNLVNTKALPYEKLTIIDFAFMYPQPDGTISGLASLSDADDHILSGDRDTVAGGHVAGTSLAARAHAHGTKVMASVGGWDGSTEFPGIAADPAKRALFAHSCVRLVTAYELDGIDIDWEFPCMTQHKGMLGDKENFTLLLAAIRDSLTALGVRAGRQYYLTAALPAGAEDCRNIEVAKITPLLDWLNVMTYDMAGDWSPVSGHNSPLYGRPGEKNSPSMDATFHLYRDTLGVPAGKINLGAAFYGHTFGNCTALYGPHTGGDKEHFGGDGATYHAIAGRMGEFTRHWDDTAKAPYLTGNAFNTVVSYDDEQSIGCKAQYVLDHQAAGLIIWELTGDFFPDGSTPLLDAIHAKFAGTPAGQ